MRKVRLAKANQAEMEERAKVQSIHGNMSIISLTVQYELRVQASFWSFATQLIRFQPHLCGTNQSSDKVK